MLCVDYKILAKIIRNRVKPILNKIINPNEIGGIKGRSIHNNLCDVRNAILSGSERKAAILNLDFAKAFERLDRELVYKTMRIYSFSNKIIDWVKKLYEDSRLKIIINGHLGNEIKMERGIKQGCPLAMYLSKIGMQSINAHTRW